MMEPRKRLHAPTAHLNAEQIVDEPGYKVMMQESPPCGRRPNPEAEDCKACWILTAEDVDARVGSQVVQNFSRVLELNGRDDGWVNKLLEGKYHAGTDRGDDGRRSGLFAFSKVLVVVLFGGGNLHIVHRNIEEEIA
jgi:hypothetical protein